MILIHVSCLQFSLMVLLSNILVTVQFQQILWYNSVSRVTLPNITWWKGRGHLLKITIAAWNCKKNPVLHWNLPTKINVYDSMNCKKGQNINLIAFQLKWNETIKSILLHLEIIKAQGRLVFQRDKWKIYICLKSFITNYAIK